MKKTVITLGIAALTGLFSCKKEEAKTTTNPLLFSTTIDNLQGWVKDNTFQKEHSVSGIWGIMVNKQMPFSYGLMIPFQNIPSANLQKVKVTTQLFSKGFNEKTSICLDVRTLSNDSTIHWQSKGIFFDNTLKTKMEKGFSEFQYTFDIANVSKENTKIKIFFWNPEADSTSQLYIDDMEVEFLEK